MILALLVSQTLGMAMPIDVTSVSVGPPTAVAELDLGKLKGDLRRVSWSADGSELYIQTAEGAPPSEKVHHYLVARIGGPVTPAESQPEWAERYWALKSDRSAPGNPSLMIDVDRKLESMKYGTGSAGAIEGGDRAGGGTVMSANNVERAALREQQTVVRLTLLGETVGEFVNERPVPGRTFSWGPRGTGIIAYTDREGHLKLLDQNQHKLTVAGVKDALLPAWSSDGTRIAYVQKSARRKYTLYWRPVTK
jgi:hypothetical protein